MRVHVADQRGTSRVKTIKRPRRLKVSADGAGVVSHAGALLLREVAAESDGADAVSGIAGLRDRPELFGAVASLPTAWRLLERIDEEHLVAVRAARAVARRRAWAAGAAPQRGQELRLDFDATLVIAHSDKKDAAPVTVQAILLL
ncbi:MAG: family transposase [Amycolatopsis sp.]|nr:family transposase [Amycolatopsis sp.]